MKRSRRRRPVLVAMNLCIVIGQGGCAADSAARQSVRLAPMARPYEGDIPVPAGFRFVESASEARSTGAARLYLRHQYEGDASKLAVRNFYREQMPLARWAKATEGNVKGEYNLRFEKGSEACTVLIRDRRGLIRRTEVQIIISQEERGQTPPIARSQR